MNNRRALIDVEEQYVVYGRMLEGASEAVQQRQSVPGSRYDKLLRFDEFTDSGKKQPYMWSSALATLLLDTNLIQHYVVGTASCNPNVSVDIGSSILEFTVKSYADGGRVFSPSLGFGWVISSLLIFDSGLGGKLQQDLLVFTPCSREALQTVVQSCSDAIKQAHPSDNLPGTSLAVLMRMAETNRELQQALAASSAQSGKCAGACHD
eukprot:GDKI01029140.1.p1 GENE.GDKI01029140.1~~GDKI01029140.1.p1  ORF type:complete len:238 (-),score=45.73 GDKI01029140.1:417-1040(-)